MYCFIHLPKELADRWRYLNGLRSMASEILEHKFQEEYLNVSLNAFDKRTRLIAQIEHDYLAPATLMRNQYQWQFVPAYDMLLLEVTDMHKEYQLNWMKAHGVSFITDVGEASDDEFGHDETMLQAMKDYKATEPQRMGFN